MEPERRTRQQVREDDARHRELDQRSYDAGQSGDHDPDGIPNSAQLGQNVPATGPGGHFI